jgi:hypothetical protein
MRFYEIDESFDSRVNKQVVKSTPNSLIIKANIGGREVIFSSSINTGFEDEKIAIIEFFEKTDGVDIFGMIA